MEAVILHPWNAERRAAMRLTTSLVVFATVSTILLADDPKKPVPRPGLRGELFDWVKKGKGKLTEEDVFAKLGHPDEVRFLDPPWVIYDIEKVWLDVNRIEVDFRDGKAIRIAGRFSPVSPSAFVNMEVLKKLKKDMTVAEVDKAIRFGAREKASLGDGITRHIWHQERKFAVNFKDGKAEGVTWSKGFADLVK